MQVLMVKVVVRGLVRVGLSATVARKPTEGKCDRIAAKVPPQFFKRQPKPRTESNELVLGKGQRGGTHSLHRVVSRSEEYF